MFVTRGRKSNPRTIQGIKCSWGIRPSNFFFFLKPFSVPQGIVHHASYEHTPTTPTLSTLLGGSAALPYIIQPFWLPSLLVHLPSWLLHLVPFSPFSLSIPIFTLPSSVYSLRCLCL